MTKRSASPRFPRPPIHTWRALVLHEVHRDTEALLRQLERIGVAATQTWPEVGADVGACDVVFFDADRGFDTQLPWAKGAAPIPLIALIGSEAPGRVEWALGQGCDAHLLKPIASAGVYSSLLIAAHKFAERRQREIAIETLSERLRKRPLVVKATLALMRTGLDEEAAGRRLRTHAMEQGLTVEEVAERQLLTDGPTALRAR
jgi:AmiR/NasT family two-component response regulator